jgi:hypothetical protein
MAGQACFAEVCRSVLCITVEARPVCCHPHARSPEELTMNDRDHFEAVCVEAVFAEKVFGETVFVDAVFVEAVFGKAVCEELRDGELAEVSGGGIGGHTVVGDGGSTTLMQANSNNATNVIG